MQSTRTQAVRQERGGSMTRQAAELLLRVEVLAGLLLVPVVFASSRTLYSIMTVALHPRLRHILRPAELLLEVLGPALLLYVAIWCLIAVYQAWRYGTSAASQGWESTGWSLLGAAFCVGQGQPGLALCSALILSAALLLEQRPHWQVRIYTYGGDVLALIVGLGLLLPLLWITVASLRAPDTPLSPQIEWWPRQPTLASYARLLALLPLARYAVNSLLIAVGGTAAALLVASAAGFALVQVSARPRHLILALSLIGLAVPPAALWLSRFLIFRQLGLLNTPAVLLAPALLGGTPLCTLLLYLAIRRLPGELWDQARLDGARPLRIWWSITLPLVRGPLTALGALIFSLFWGNTLDALLYLSDDRWRTLAAALQSLYQLDRSDWSVVLAAALVVTAPAALVFGLAQRTLLDSLKRR